MSDDLDGQQSEWMKWFKEEERFRHIESVSLVVRHLRPATKDQERFLGWFGRRLQVRLKKTIIHQSRGMQSKVFNNIVLTV